ncbi:hypothetical protein FS935_11100 [Metabacillus litoralis]|uniref:Uncharacterized protein n=1 Tax=Metabacillus litoralis TaxID=152268 RepID=A0A5C6W3J9_9BACI|nr:hypothetical protein [Metabacillus litoralis]TXC90463.1 hypothetical protein FS935_11100 [Metabacillus litoralis]
MGNTCRYVVNAVGKCGETYYTQIDSKRELQNWIEDHKEKLILDELKVVDRKVPPFVNWLLRVRG